MTTEARRLPIILLALYAALFIALGIAPYDRAVWWAENIPIVATVAALCVMYRRGIRFSSLAYVLMSVLPYLHTIGGHFTFERVPFDWVTDAFGFERNHYDRIAHFSVGFYAIGLAELLTLKRWVTRPGLAALFGIFAIGTIAAVYEIIEWIYAAVAGGSAGAAFLGSQGDPWDAQKDMLADLLGALTAIAIFYIALSRRSSPPARPLA